jgi:uncharacterized tellurite resistance protein B-like protein
MDLEERQKIGQLLETMIAADGEIKPAERDFLRKMLERLGISGERASSPSSLDVGRSMATLRSLPQDVGLKVMALLVDAACVDGVVAPEERALLVASAATLGICTTALEDRIQGRLRANGVSPSRVPAPASSPSRPSS